MAIHGNGWEPGRGIQSSTAFNADSVLFDFQRPLSIFEVAPASRAIKEEIPFDPRGPVKQHFSISVNPFDSLQTD
jgi:hypothetical protein